MTTEETKQILKSIFNAYPGFDVTKEKAELWHSFLKNMNFNKVNARLRQHILTKEFPPKISEITVPVEEKNSVLEQMAQWERESAKRDFRI